MKAGRWVWLDPAVLLAAHDEQLAEHGGPGGVRDPGAFESAMSRAPQRAASVPSDAASLAAAYGFGIARNHPFVDGNKRTAFVAAELCLMLNGLELAASDADCVITTLGLAAGDIDEEAFAAWIRAHVVIPDPD